MPDEVVIDSKTGLPVLPKGYFFRVKFGYSEYYGNAPTYELHIRRKRVLRTSEYMAGSTIPDIGTRNNAVSSLSSLTEKNILHAAIKLFPQLAAEKEYRERISRNKKLVGNYPPNSIGG
jgi:hypothetical protein